MNLLTDGKKYRVTPNKKEETPASTKKTPIEANMTIDSPFYHHQQEVYAL